MPSIDQYVVSDHQQVLSGVADLAETHHALKQHIMGGLETQVADLAHAHSEVMGYVLDSIEMHVGEMCSLQQWVLQQITDGVAGHGQSLTNTYQWVQGTLDDFSAEQARKQRDREKRAARRQNRVEPSECATTETLPLYSPAPVAGAIDGIVIRIRDAQGWIQPSMFPVEMWSPEAESRVWWSTDRSPATRVEVAYWRDENANSQPAGELYINISTDMPTDDVGKLLDSIGIDANTYHIYTPEESYELACTTWGQVTVDCVYDAYGMHTYRARANDLPRLPPSSGSGGNVLGVPLGRITDVAGQLQQQLPEAERQRPQGILQQAVNVAAGQLVNPGLQAIVPQLAPQAVAAQVQAALPQLDVCGIINYVSRFFSIPENTIPPCGSVEQLAKRIRGDA